MFAHNHVYDVPVSDLLYRTLAQTQIPTSNPHLATFPSGVNLRGIISWSRKLEPLEWDDIFN